MDGEMVRLITDQTPDRSYGGWPVKAIVYNIYKQYLQYLLTLIILHLEAKMYLELGTLFIN